MNSIYYKVAEAIKAAEPGFVALREGGQMSERKRGWAACAKAVAAVVPERDRSHFLNQCGVYA